MSSKQLTPVQYLIEAAEESQLARDIFVRQHSEDLVNGARILGESFRSGGKVLIAGNGGSAADAQHLAAEFVGRLVSDRRPLPAIALTTDSSILTAVSNDYSFSQVFTRQLQALARNGDVFIAISTSGNSPNVLQAIAEAKKIGCRVITLTGGTGGKMFGLGDVSLNVSEGKNSCRIQETHIFAVHTLVDLLERFFLEE